MRLAVYARVLLRNSGFCNGCITKRILLLQAFPFIRKPILCRSKNITIFIYLIFYHREIVKLNNFMTLSLSYANTDLWCSRCKIHCFVAAPHAQPTIVALTPRILPLDSPNRRHLFVTPWHAISSLFCTLCNIACWGRILRRNWDKSLKSFPPCYSKSPLLTDFTRPLLEQKWFDTGL
jgi:hypothetical protein